jgi:hypothetical protein
LYISCFSIDISSSFKINLITDRDKRGVAKSEKLIDISRVKFLATNKKQVFIYEIIVNKKSKISYRYFNKRTISFISNKEIEVEWLQSDIAAIYNEKWC